MPSGGNHPPRQAAAVSGPGALSKRTDGQPIRDVSGGAYGDRQELRGLQQAAPLASTGAAPGSTGAVSGGIDPSQLIGLGEPTAQPETPVTAGAAGRGPGQGWKPSACRWTRSVKRRRRLASTSR